MLAALAQDHRGVRGPGVLGHVVERLLGNAVESHRTSGGPRGLETHVDGDACAADDGLAN